MMSSSRSKFLLLAILLIIFMSSSASSDPPATGDWQLVWSDEFDSGPTPTPPDPSNWGYENGYVRNREWQYYTSDIQNAYCQDGFLHIEAHQHPPGTYPTGSETGQDGSISSASIRSMGKVAFKYGWLEIRARIDTQWGSWPAFWTLGASGEWPDGGECDIMEYYRDMLKFNVAWWKTGDPRWTARWDGETVYVSSLPSAWVDEFHVWVMEWDEHSVKLYMDDVLYNTWDSSQDDNGDGDVSVEGFQQPHYMLINQAIGGTAGGDASGVVYPTNYEVDYVRWYQNASEPSTYIDDDDASITYSGTWGTYSGNPGYLGTEHYSWTVGSTATFTFTGTKAAYYGFKRNDLGYADILIDDVLVDTIDCYDSTSQYFVMLYETPSLAYGEHTLGIRVNGGQNPSSSDTPEIIVDAFTFSQTPTQGDTNNDGIVNNVDLSIVQGQWQSTGCGDCGGADLTGEGDVTISDVLIVGQNWTNDYTLMGHWPLDGDASDSSSYNHSSTIYGSPTWDPNGRIGGTLEFDGGDDYIKIDNFLGIPGGQSRTVSAWIQTSQDDGEILTYGEGTATGGRWVFRVKPGGILNVQVGAGTISGTTVITDGSWHHVAAVLENDGTPTLDEVKLYVDGTEEAVPGTATAINTIPDNEVKIGVFSDTAKYFEGLIDEVRIYNRALTEAEIQDLAEMGG